MARRDATGMPLYYCYDVVFNKYVGGFVKRSEWSVFVCRARLGWSAVNGIGVILIVSTSKWCLFCVELKI